LRATTSRQHGQSRLGALAINDARKPQSQPLPLRGGLTAFYRAGRDRRCTWCLQLFQDGSRCISMADACCWVAPQAPL
jgi:hypothetical protein